jgi:hypothetical protein
MWCSERALPQIEAELNLQRANFLWPLARGFGSKRLCGRTLLCPIISLVLGLIGRYARKKRQAVNLGYYN